MIPEREVPAKIRSAWPPLILGAMAAGVTLWAQRYGPVPRLLPTVVGVSLLVLCALDLASRFDTRAGAVLRATLGADFRNREMGHDPVLRAELVQIGWMAGCILLMLAIGILPTVPVFIALYMRRVGGRPWIASILAGLAVLLFVTVVFEMLLDYALYRGLLFDPKGISAW